MQRQQQIVATTLTESGAQPLTERADIVILGAGITGQTAAFEAHKLAPLRSITFITDQHYATIYTPALQQLLRRNLAPEQILAFPAGSQGIEGVDRVHSRVEQINAQSRPLTLSGDRHLEYGSLLIATGSVPRGKRES